MFFQPITTVEGYSYNVGKTIINHPAVITILIGGMVTIPSHALWHSFTHIIAIDRKTALTAPKTSRRLQHRRQCEISPSQRRPGAPGSLPRLKQIPAIRGLRMCIVCIHIIHI